MRLNTFDERISWLLKQPDHGNGMSQKELAAAMEISSQYLSTLMRKESPRRPNMRHLAAAARCLNTTISFLVLETDDPAPPHQHDILESPRPCYSGQADKVAQLIDTLPDDAQRQMIVVVVEAIVKQMNPL